MSSSSEEVIYERIWIEVFRKNTQSVIFVNFSTQSSKKKIFFAQDTSSSTIYLHLYERHLLIRIDTLRNWAYFLLHCWIRCSKEAILSSVLCSFLALHGTLNNSCEFCYLESLINCLIFYICLCNHKKNLFIREFRVFRRKRKPISQSYFDFLIK